jgi:hypothetical protein
VELTGDEEELRILEASLAPVMHIEKALAAMGRADLDALCKTPESPCDTPKERYVGEF